MVATPYLTFCLFLALLAALPLAAGRARLWLLAASFIFLIGVFFRGGAVAIGLAGALTLFTMLFRKNSLRIAGGAILVALLVYFKLPKAGGVPMQSLPFLAFVPIGYSFQFFGILGYWVDRSRDPEPERVDFLALFTALLFAPALVAGPYVSSSYLVRQLREPRGPAQLGTGLALLSWGIFKKALADSFSVGMLSSAFLFEEHSRLGAVSSLIILTARVYLDFSGYSDLARGAAMLLGFELPVNFYRPFQARTYGEFWARWNQSLSSWFREYVFSPLVVLYPRFRNRISPRAYMMVISALVCELIAAWHGLSLVFLVWYLIVVAGLWLPTGPSLLSRPLALFLIFVSTSVVLSGSLGRWFELWNDVLFGSFGGARSLGTLVALVTFLFLVQAVDEQLLGRVARNRAWAAVLGVCCWFLIFVFSFSGRPFLYAGF